MKNIRICRVIKVLEIILFVLLLVSVGLIITACKCTHDYEESNVRHASCSSVGETTYTCKKCGDSYTVELPKLDGHTLLSSYFGDDKEHWQKCKDCDFITSKTKHEFVKLVSSEPSTCVKHGIEVKSCVCGETNIETLPFASHSYTIYQNQGDLHWQKCANCDMTTDKVKHQYTIQGEIIPSTCTLQGSSTKTCICGESHVEVLPLAQHSYTNTVHNDTKHWLVCSVCNEIDPNQAEAPHDFVVNRIEAECEKAGKIVTTCNGCSYEKTETLPALEHKLDKTNFSKSATGSGHYYKCDLCKKDIAEHHTLIDCECPDNYNRSATCYRNGHQDQKCEVCNWQNHFTTSRTDDHNMSLDWQSDGVWHWHVCTNGDGKNECDYKSDNAQHTWETKTILATCTEDGRQWRECSVCAKEQSGSSKTLKAMGHKYSQLVEVLKNPLCEQDGVAKMKCSECEEIGEVIVEKLGHDWSKYNFNEQGHWKKCATCGAEQTGDKPTKHTADKNLDEIVVDGNCVTDSKIKHTCQFCESDYIEVIVAKGHNYVHDDPNYEDLTKFADPTCTEYGWYMATCSVCEDHAKIMGDELAPHDLIYHKAKEPTDTKNGNINYHECIVCGKFFSSSNCENELAASDIFIYSNGIEVESISKLYDIAQSIDDGTSANYYRITATVSKITAKRLTVVDSNNDMLGVDIPSNISLGSISSGDEITLIAKLYVVKDGEEVLMDLVDVKILSVPEKNGEYMLWVESNVNQFGSDCAVQVYYGEDNEGNPELYEINTTYYYALMPELDNQLIIRYYKNNYNSNVSLIKVIVNGKAYTANDGEIVLTITGDMHVKLTFGTMPSTSVSLDKIEAVNNNTHMVDEYVSYKYVGNPSDNGYINANSHLIFNVNNANIVGIVITYANHNLEGDSTVLQNKLSIGVDENHMYLQTQIINNKLKVILEFDTDSGYVRIDYFASSCQARIEEITILYQTNNTF